MQLKNISIHADNKTDETCNNFNLFFKNTEIYSKK